MDVGLWLGGVFLPFLDLVVLVIGIQRTNHVESIKVDAAAVAASAAGVRIVVRRSLLEGRHGDDMNVGGDRGRGIVGGTLNFVRPTNTEEGTGSA